MEMTIASKYKLIEKIGAGSFGDVYLGREIYTRKEVAAKVEKSTRYKSLLKQEAAVYKEMQDGIGIPKYLYYGIEGKNNVLVIELMGQSIEQLHKRCKNRFSLPTLLELVDQMLSRVEFFHYRGFLHRDIKPENFMIGRGSRDSTVFIIDYGLSKRYLHPVTKLHIPFRNDKKITGTARYESLNTHLGIEQGRRDDLECLAYTLLYLAKGQLPWQGLIHPKKHQKYNAILKKKMFVPIPKLCEGLPAEFGKFLAYSRGLNFTEAPDYDTLRKHYMFTNNFLQLKKKENNRMTKENNI